MLVTGRYFLGVLYGENRPKSENWANLTPRSSATFTKLQKRWYYSAAHWHLGDVLVGNHLFVIFAVLDVSFAVNSCLNCSFFLHLYLQWPTNRKSYMVCQMAPFLVTLKSPSFQSHAILQWWIPHKQLRYGHSCHKMWIGKHTQAFEWYYFQWSWVTAGLDFKLTMICWTAPLSMILNDPKPRFQGHTVIYRWISQKRYEIET